MFSRARIKTALDFLPFKSLLFLAGIQEEACTKRERKGGGKDEKCNYTRFCLQLHFFLSFFRINKHTYTSHIHSLQRDRNKECRVFETSAKCLKWLNFFSRRPNSLSHSLCLLQGCKAMQINKINKKKRIAFVPPLFIYILAFVP